MNKSVKILRSLAKKYFELANQDVNYERLKLHRAVNDLDMIRPVVLIDELPWNELNFDGSLTLECDDDILREAEQFFRKKIFQYTHFPADMVLKPYYGVEKIILSSGIGIKKNEETLSVDNSNHIVAHEYKDMIKTEEDLEKLVLPTLTYDYQETSRKYQRVAEAIGDILPVKITGKTWFFVDTWDQISELRGVTPLLMDLIDRPEFTRKIVEKLTDVHKSRLDQLETLDAFDNDTDTVHCTPAANSALKPYDENGKVTRKNIWGRGVAQILASVSKDMRDEFDITYMKETVGQCGLVYYGCCEPLDTMIDIVEKIPNIRKIGVTPWADPVNAAEKIGEKYVYSSKPNPAHVSGNVFNKDIVQGEMSTILEACKRNRCNIDITLKDISTINYKMDNIVSWEKTVMKMVKDF